MSDFCYHWQSESDKRISYIASIPLKIVHTVPHKSCWKLDGIACVKLNAKNFLFKTILIWLLFFKISKHF